MKTRVITGTVVTLFMLAVVCLYATPAFAIAISVICAMAVWELLRAFEMHKVWILSVPSMVIAIALPTVSFVLFKILGKQAVVFITVLALTFFVLMFYSFFVAVFKRGKLNFATLSASLVLTIYAVTCFSALCVLNYLEGLGIFTVGMVFIGAWVSDVFAYFTGRLFGKHKLIPEVSPKKTVEGSIGAIVFTTLAFVLYGLIVSAVTDLKANYVVLVICGPILSAVGQIGDLIASVVKRERGIKDYGTLLPGHGGIMDRFDSVLTVAGATMVIALIAAPFK